MAPCLTSTAFAADTADSPVTGQETFQVEDVITPEAAVTLEPKSDGTGDEEAEPATEDPGAGEGERGVLGVCGGGWKHNVYNYKSKHHGWGVTFKDGPGGTMTTSSQGGGSISASLSAGAGFSVSAAVAEAKAEVGTTVAAEISWSVVHTYKHDISSRKYGHMRWGTWGKSASWERYYQLPNCKKTQRTTGSVKLPGKELGYKYWETSS